MFGKPNEEFQRLIERRKLAAERTGLFNEREKLRLFQLSDYIYSELIPSLSLAGRKITLHCIESGNLGDVAHLFYCAESIRKNRPDYDIEILLILQTANEALIRSLFPVDQYKIAFFTGYDYEKKEAALAYALQTGGVIGISVGFYSPQLYGKHHRSISEYGYDRTIKDDDHNTLSMGLSSNEEGLLLPHLNKRQLTDLQTPWIKNAIPTNGKIYHFHLRNWTMQMAALYTLAKLEAKSSDPITIVMPGLNNTFQELIEWKMLDLHYLEQFGITRLSRVTSAGTETIESGRNGKELRVICGNIPKFEMEAIQQAADDFFGCAGDVSLSECIVLNKVPFYDIYEHKLVFAKELRQFAIENQLMALGEYFNLFIRLFEIVYQINKNIIDSRPRRNDFFAADPVFDLNLPYSVPRKAAETASPSIKEIAEKIADMASNPRLTEETRIFNQLIKDTRDFVPRLITMVDRAVILYNYPALIEDEKKLWNAFSKNEITFDEVLSQLRNAITRNITHDMHDVPTNPGM